MSSTLATTTAPSPVELWLGGMPPVQATQMRALYPIMITLLTSAGGGLNLRQRGQQQQRGSRSVDDSDAGGPIQDIDSPLPEYDYVIGKIRHIHLSEFKWHLYRA